MNTRLIFLAFLTLITSCKENNPALLLPESNGTINSISVVIDDDLWGSEIGALIRKEFAYPIYGLPQMEPVFDLKQIPTSVFSGFATNSRTILKVGLSQTERFATYKNKYAKPQLIIDLSSVSQQKLKEQISNSKVKVLTKLYAHEIAEKQRRVLKSKNTTKLIKEIFGFDILFSSSYRIAKSSKNFLWIRRDTEKGSVNFYISKIKNKENLNINHIRDSISKKLIPGPIEKTYMSTDKSYTTKSNEIRLTESLKVIETRGIWEVKNQFMGGPFISYIASHQKNSEELYILEGFVYSPGTTKRDYIFELEAVFKSIKF
jgi:hypothetical protein|tara:strand:+ start:5068 stop:6021 length:954 start_codon:yes stop_codon:yes gene_type:complete